MELVSKGKKLWGRIAAGSAAMVLSAGLSIALAPSASAEEYNWGWIQCSYPYHPTLSSRASGVVTHQQLIGANYWVTNSWNNGSVVILRDQKIANYFFFFFKLNADAARLRGRSYLCE